jgi:hypothetical protein
VDPRERWALEICCEHFAVFVLLYVEVRGDGCSVVDRLGYWDHRCASRSQSVDYPGHGIADGVVSSVGVQLKNPSIRPNRIPERLLPHMLVEQSMPKAMAGLAPLTTATRQERKSDIKSIIEYKPCIAAFAPLAWEMYAFREPLLKRRSSLYKESGLI